MTDPTKPNLLQEFSTGETGMGTHMNFYDGGKYAYLECAWDDQLRMENAQRAMSHGLMIVDLSDPQGGLAVVGARTARKKSTRNTRSPATSRPGRRVTDP